jgi:hypothetical protein
MLSKLGVIAGTLLVGAAGIAPAQAARYVHDDAAADQTRTTCTAPNPCSDAVDATVTNGDITRVTAVHGARRVRVLTNYTDVATTTDESIQVVRIVTNTGLQRLATIYTPAGSADAVTFLMRPNGDRVRCRYLRAVRDVDANVMGVVVPRSCLGYPRSVRVGVGHIASPDLNGDAGVADDALVSGALGSNITLSPRIRRG